MKKIILILFSIILTGGVRAQTMYPSGVTGCIARWTFDTPDQPFLTTLPDMSGNNNNGTPFGIATSSGFRNVPFKAGAFDGSTSWAEVAHKTMLNPNEITIISLVKLNSYNAALCESSQIVSKGYPGFIAGNYGQGLSDNPYDGGCGIYSPNFTQLVTQIGSPILTVPPGNYILLNKWFFYASVIGANSVKHYQIEMDTSQKALTLSPISSIPGTYSVGLNTQNVSIGRHLNPSYPYWLNGDMDELILFNRALDNSEIYSIYSYLWGWASGIENNLRNDEVYVTCNDKVLNVSSSSNQIEKVSIFDLSGRKLAECKNSFNQIDLTHIQTGMLIAKISFGNMKSVSKKIMNR